MQQKSVAASSTQGFPGRRSAPGAEQKLKSERVQLRMQVTERVKRKLQDVFGGQFCVGDVVTMSFELTKPRGGAPPGIVEAGSASGTPGQNRQPSTVRKEVDHEESNLVR